MSLNISGWKIGKKIGIDLPGDDLSHCLQIFHQRCIQRGSYLPEEIIASNEKNRKDGYNEHQNQSGAEAGFQRDNVA